MIPKPTKPTLLMLVAASQVRRDPRQAIHGTTGRFVFATDPAGITQRIDESEQERVVDFAAARLMAPGIVRQLHMADAIEKALDGRCQVSLHDLHVIDVVLQE